MRPHRTVTAQVPPSLFLTSIGRALTSSGVRDSSYRPITIPAAPAVEAPYPGLAARSSQASQPSPAIHHTTTINTINSPKHPYPAPLPCETPTQSQPPITLLPAADATWSVIGGQMGAKSYRSIGGIALGWAAGATTAYLNPCPVNQSINIPGDQETCDGCDMSRRAHWFGPGPGLGEGKRACMHARSVAAWEGGRQWLGVLPVYPLGRPSDTFFLCSLSCIALITGFWLHVSPSSLSALLSPATAIRR